MGGLLTVKCRETVLPRALWGLWLLPVSAVLRHPAVTPGVTSSLLQPKEAKKLKRSPAKRNKSRLHAVKQHAKESLRQYQAFRGREGQKYLAPNSPPSPPERQRGDKEWWRQATREIVRRCQVNHSGTITDRHSTL